MTNEEIKKKEDKQLLIKQQVSQFVSTPLPPPEWMEKYNNINPSIIEEILEQYKINNDHVRNIDTRQIELVAKSQLHGFIFGIICVIGAIITSYLGYEKAAITIAGTCILGALRALIRK